MPKILIIGKGNIGQALDKTLQDNPDCQIETYDRKTGGGNLPAQAAEANCILFCVPSQALAEILAEIEPTLKEGSISISLSKGIEEKDFRTADLIFESALGKNKFWAILGGPMLSSEISDERGGIAVAASKDKKTFEEIQKIFSGTTITIFYSPDPRSTALAGVIKNVFSIGLGLIDGLDWGNNIKGWLAGESLSEMGKLIKFLGGKEDAAYGHAGIGDLIATGFSQTSRNRQAGEEIAKHNKTKIEAEGLSAIPILADAVKNKIETFPILQTLDNIISKREEAGGSLTRLLGKLSQASVPNK